MLRKESEWFLNLVVEKFPDVLTEHQEKELSKRVLSGDKEAVNELVMKNIRLVYLIALELKPRNYYLFEDMVQEGILGLTLAAEKFNHEFGSKFATYARYWIKQKMTIFVYSSGTIRIPVGTNVVARKVSRMAQDENKTVEDICKETGLPKHTVRRALLASNIVICHMENENREDCFGDNFTCDHSVHDNEIFEVVERFVSSLSSRDEDIARSIFLSDKRVRLRVLAERHGLSVERIRQIKDSIATRIKRFLENEGML